MVVIISLILTILWFLWLIFCKDFGPDITIEGLRKKKQVHALLQQKYPSLYNEHHVAVESLNKVPLFFQLFTRRLDATTLSDSLLEYALQILKELGYDGYSQKILVDKTNMYILVQYRNSFDDMFFLRKLK